MEEFYEECGVSVDKLGYMEAHGTGKNATFEEKGISKVPFNKLTGKVPQIRKMGPDTVLSIEEEYKLE
nr:unnamed protein product [Callosobruchus analis]